MKEIIYPTQEWLDSWIDKYMEDNPNEKIEDFEALKEDAMCEWWDAQVDKGNPTPYDLTEEQEKEVKKLRKNAKKEKAVNAYGQTVKRERKPNDNKRWIVEKVKTLFEELALNRSIDSMDVSNIERTIEIWKDEKHYTLTLTEHRAPKAVKG